MALRKIVFTGDEILRKRCREVAVIDDRIRMILDDMLETMRSRNGLGIAAPQVGIMRRMFIVEAEEGDVIEIINPEIIEMSGIQVGEEGCLSVPGYVGTVERPEYIKIAGLDRSGNPVVCEGTGMKAVALCHEFDHLEGVLYTDKAVNVRETDTDSEFEG